MDFERQAREREIIQTHAEQLSLKHRHLLITWATGCGKGKAVMRCIDKSPSEKKWLVVVPEILQIDNFKKDLVKHGFDYLLQTKIEEVICYASLDKYEKSEYNLALNEVHKLSINRADIVSTILFDQIVSDSATVPSRVRTRLKEICKFEEFEITLDEAIQRGILPPPEVFLIPIELDKIHKDVSVRVNYGKKGTFTRIMTQDGYNALLEKDLRYWEERNIEEGYPQWIRNKLNQIASTRKKFLSSCKTKEAQKLLSNLAGTRLICFTGSNEQADVLGGNHAIHSKKTAKHNKETVAKFDEFEIGSVYVNKMMREGMNLNGIEAGIIVQLDSGADDGLSFLQMTGRSLRAMIPKIYILYAKGTQDEKYLKRALTNINKKYIVYGNEGT